MSDEDGPFQAATFRESSCQKAKESLCLGTRRRLNEGDGSFDAHSHRRRVWSTIGGGGDSLTQGKTVIPKGSTISELGYAWQSAPNMRLL